VNIRAFNFETDYEAAVHLWETAGPGIHVGRSDTPAEVLKKLQRDPDLFLVAEVDGQVIGTVIGGFDGRRGLVYHLAVAQAYRKQGIGTSLMQELEQRMARLGCLRSYLLVVPGNTDTVAYYEDLGWKKLDLHILAKDLD
jgi:ribosomal protein S18 acetylase RimI-like enzyme